MDSTPSSPKKTDHSKKSDQSSTKSDKNTVATKPTSDTMDKTKNTDHGIGSTTKVSTKTNTPGKVLKRSVKKVKPKPLKDKTKPEGSIERLETSKTSSESKIKPSPSLSRPMPLSRKQAAINSASNSPKPTEESSSHNEGPNAIKPPPIKRQKLDISGNQESPCDPFCWSCHREGTTLDCQVCPRSFHTKCDQQGEGANFLPQDPKNWICKECRSVILAEDIDTRSTAMSMLTIDQLCNLLKFALNRMKQHALKLLADTQPDAFSKPVSEEEYPQYLEYIVHPVDLSLLEKNIKKKVYGSTEAFLADVKWLSHNSLIFNGSAHKLTSVARSLVKICRAEMREIEICPDCYLHANTLNDNWFLEPCRKAHVLVWAKLKGFPYWPGKVMQVENSNADIRFFGAHDRAWVPIHLCYLLSYEMPQPLKVKKKAAFDTSLEELDAHIQKLRVKLGGFDYAPTKTMLDPERLYLQPISKVSTGRRHSDAEQNSLSKGRTVTIVTSSWMRRLQAEGFAKPKDKKDQKKTPKKSKKGSSSASNSPKTSRSTDSKPISSLQLKREIFESKLKMEDSNSQDKSDTAKNPPPMGVFEISDSSSLEINQPLQLRSPSIVLSKVPAQRADETAAEKIKRNLMSSMGSGSDAEAEGVDEDTIISPQGSPPIISEMVPETDKDGTTTSQDEEASEVVKETSPPPPQCEVSSTTSLAESEKQIDLSTLSSHLSPKKTNSLFVQKLQETIQSCKAQLGIEGLHMDEEMAPPSTESEGDDDHSMNSADDKDADKAQVQSKDSKEAAPDMATKTTESAPRIASPPVCDNFSNISSEDGENLVIDETTGDKDNEDTRVQSGTDVEMADDSENTVSNSRTKGKTSSTSPVQEKSAGIKRKSDGSRAPSEAASTSSQKPSEVNQRSTIASPSSADTQTCNGSNITETDPSNITNYAHKLIDFMQELCKDAGSPGNPQATIRSLELELEKLRWRHQQELLEVKHNSDLILLEARASMELDKRKALAELREKLELEKSRCTLELKLEMEKEKQQAIEATKKIQWCANCGKEAIFYCCWNTSYCNHNCQQAHWISHMNMCTQNQPNVPSVSGVQGNQPNVTILTSNNNKNMLPTPQLTRPRMGPPPTPVITGPVQLQYLSGNQCYQLVPTSTIVTPNTTNVPLMPKTFSGPSQIIPSTQGNLNRN